MGSTESPAAGPQGVGPSSCGLVGSLFPNSCRGRAESFARRLHRRLTSLGGEPHFSDDGGGGGGGGGGGPLKNPTENSWLHGSTGEKTSCVESIPISGERVLDCQPRHSPESEVYYDFDIEDGPEDIETDGTASPAEMENTAQLAKILVNSTILKSNHSDSCHCSPGPRPPETNQTDYVFSSPLPGLSPDTDNSEIYFDPAESSEAEKFFDPRGTCDSDAASNRSISEKISSRRRRFDGHGERNDDNDDNSESSSSSRAIETLENARPTPPVGLPIGCSSEESINGRSSIETTSPSNESLWSTFEDSTMSLQDEASTTCDPPSTSGLPKSHSDSEIKPPPTALDGFDEVDRVSENTSCRVPSECPSGSEIDESVDNEIDRGGTDKNFANQDISKLIDRLARSPLVDPMVDAPIEDEESEIDGRTVANGEGKGDEEEEEGEEKTLNAPRRVRRCSSLKSCKTPPGTPGRKKIVRFADVLGLDLADVRTFLDEIPKVPNSAYSDLKYDEAFQKDTSPVNFWGTGPATFTTALFAATIGPKVAATGTIAAGTKIDRILVPLFQQPAGLSNFLDLVRERRVCLENVLVQDPVTMCLQGTVRVLNLDFHKSVHLRYSLDSWLNFSDLQATYAANSCDGFSDKFTFSLYCHTLKVGQRLEMAVRFQCKGTQYWDNNAGINYCFQCLPATSLNTGTYATPIVNPATRDCSPAFY